mmetsp:Transcript_4914/g.13731  ORF Transcript_4914/g.13731 Transcript_4914/m.13731 type:complete len:227 (-) Transcript_4914:70-750(-)
MLSPSSILWAMLSKKSRSCGWQPRRSAIRFKWIALLRLATDSARCISRTAATWANGTPPPVCSSCKSLSAHSPRPVLEATAARRPPASSQSKICGTSGKSSKPWPSFATTARPSTGNGGPAVRSTSPRQRVSSRSKTNASGQKHKPSSKPSTSARVDARGVALPPAASSPPPSPLAARVPAASPWAASVAPCTPPPLAGVCLARRAFGGIVGQSATAPNAKMPDAH